MEYEAITEGIFLSRPNRFIAKVLIDGREETVHVKNTGRCRELLVPGAAVYLERAKNPDRKTAYDLVAVEKQGLGLINMDSQAPNQVAGEWLASPLARQVLPDKPEAIHPEYTYGKSRVDFYFECSGEKCLMEVKGVTLEREGIAYFPDAPTERGVKHIRELEAALKDGYRSYLAFVIQMPGIMEVYPNSETHPAFGEALYQACANGLQVLALGCEIQRDELKICRARRVEY